MEEHNTMDGYVCQCDWRVKENDNVNFSLGGLILHNQDTIAAYYWQKNIYPEEIIKTQKNDDGKGAFIDLLAGGDANGREFQYPVPVYNSSGNFYWNSVNAQLLFKLYSTKVSPTCNKTTIGAQRMLSTPQHSLRPNCCFYRGAVAHIETRGSSQGCVYETVFNNSNTYGGTS